MKTNCRKIILSIFATLVFGIMGFLTGSWILQGIQSGQLAWWQSLSKPPGGAIRFVNVIPNFFNKSLLVSVETPAGKVFSYRTEGSGNWEEVSPSEVKQVSNCQYHFDLSKKPPVFSNLPSSPVIDCTMMIWSWEWIADEDYFVILAEGDVWKWRYYTGFDQMLYLLCGVPLLAVIVGWSPIALTRFRRRGNTDKHQV